MRSTPHRPPAPAHAHVPDSATKAAFLGLAADVPLPAARTRAQQFSSSLVALAGNAAVNGVTGAKGDGLSSLAALLSKKAPPSRVAPVGVTPAKAVPRFS